MTGHVRKGYRTASDGLLARESGEWAREKLHYLAQYMAIFNGGMKNKWPKRVYVDLMTGCARNIISTTGFEFPGSPILALECPTPFSTVVLVEQDAQLLEALRARVRASGGTAEILPGNCNDPAVVEAVRARVPPGSLALTFVDMLGLDVTFATLRALSRGCAMDLVITFQVNDLTRNVWLALGGKVDRERFDAFFGDPGWEEIARGDRNGRDLASDLTEFYCARLATIGYAHVAQLHVLMKNGKNAPLYRLVLAGKHQKAEEFFRKISKIEYSGQRGFAF